MQKTIHLTALNIVFTAQIHSQFPQQPKQVGIRLVLHYPLFIPAPSAPFPLQHFMLCKSWMMPHCAWAQRTGPLTFSGQGG